VEAVGDLVSCPYCLLEFNVEEPKPRKSIWFILSNFSWSKINWFKLGVSGLAIFLVIFFVVGLVVAAVFNIIKVICSNETGKQLSVESCLDDSKLMGFVSSEFVKRIVLWSKKVDSLAKLKAKNKSSELSKLKELAKGSKTEKKSSTKTSKKKSSKPAATATAS